MHCTNCGELLANNTKFCGSCGRETAQDSTNTAPQSEAPSTTDTSTVKEPVKHSINRLSAAEGFGLFSIVIAGLAFVAWYELGDYWKDPNWTVVYSIAFFVPWVALAALGFSKKKGATISIGSGLIGGCLALLVAGYLLPQENSSTNAPTARQEQSQKTAPAVISKLNFFDGRGEWYTNVANAALGGNNRQLWIRGSLRNLTSDTLTNVNCVATLYLRFSNGRDTQTSSNNLCSNSPSSNLDTSWTIKASSTAHIENRKTGARELWQGPQVEGKFMDYDITRVVLKLHVTASTPFGDNISTTVFSGQIPAPSHRAAFILTQK